MNQPNSRSNNTSYNSTGTNLITADLIAEAIADARSHNPKSASPHNRTNITKKLVQQSNKMAQNRHNAILSHSRRTGQLFDTNDNDDDNNLDTIDNNQHQISNNNNSSLNQNNNNSSSSMINRRISSMQTMFQPQSNTIQPQSIQQQALIPNQQQSQPFGTYLTSIIRQIHNYTSNQQLQYQQQIQQQLSLMQQQQQQQPQQQKPKQSLYRRKTKSINNDMGNDSQMVSQSQNMDSQGMATPTTHNNNTFTNQSTFNQNNPFNQSIQSNPFQLTNQQSFGNQYHQQQQQSIQQPNDFKLSPTELQHVIKYCLQHDPSGQFTFINQSDPQYQSLTTNQLQQQHFITWEEVQEELKQREIVYMVEILPQIETYHQHIHEIHNPYNDVEPELNLQYQSDDDNVYNIAIDDDPAVEYDTIQQYEHDMYMGCSQ